MKFCTCRLFRCDIRLLLSSPLPMPPESTFDGKRASHTLDSGIHVARTAHTSIFFKRSYLKTSPQPGVGRHTLKRTFISRALYGIFTCFRFPELQTLVV